MNHKSKFCCFILRNMNLSALLKEANTLIFRISPKEAFQELQQNRVQLVDIRSSESRVRNGVIDGSFHIERTVLEWRFEIDGKWRNKHLNIHQRIVLICDHGCSSQLAAATLSRMGYSAGDVIGGIEAWKEICLPLQKPLVQLILPQEYPGMNCPEKSRFQGDEIN